VNQALTRWPHFKSTNCFLDRLFLFSTIWVQLSNFAPLHLKSPKSPVNSVILKLVSKIELLLLYQRSICISNLRGFRPSYVLFGTWSLAKFWCSWPRLKSAGTGCQCRRGPISSRGSGTLRPCAGEPCLSYTWCWAAHTAGVTRVYCSKTGNLLTMSSLSGRDGGTNKTLLAGTLVVGVQGFSFWPIISYAPQTRKRCIACPPSLKSTAAL
jgi:hypothetical protein